MTLQELVQNNETPFSLDFRSSSAKNYLLEGKMIRMLFVFLSVGSFLISLLLAWIDFFIFL